MGIIYVCIYYRARHRYRYHMTSYISTSVSLQNKFSYNGIFSEDGTVLKLIVLFIITMSTLMVSAQGIESARGIGSTQGSKSTQGIDNSKGMEMAQGIGSAIGYTYPNLQVPKCRPRMIMCCPMSVTKP